MSSTSDSDDRSRPVPPESGHPRSGWRAVGVSAALAIGARALTGDWEAAVTVFAIALEYFRKGPGSS